MMRQASIVALAVMLGACAVAPESGSHSAPLLGTEWKLTRLADATVTPPMLAAAPRRPSLQLHETDQRASGFAGCNMFAGPYELSQGKLRFGALAMTRMACLQGSEIELAYGKALAATRGYELAGSLTLLGEGDRALATFVAE
jgi:heat shock protein HslJ